MLWSVVAQDRLHEPHIEGEDKRNIEKRCVVYTRTTRPVYRKKRKTKEMLYQTPNSKLLQLLEEKESQTESERCRRRIHIYGKR
jgi:hypothetical protein